MTGSWPSRVSGGRVRTSGPTLHISGSCQPWGWGGGKRGGSGLPDLVWDLALSPISTTSWLCGCLDYLLLHNKRCQVCGLKLPKISQCGPGSVSGTCCLSSTPLAPPHCAGWAARGREPKRPSLLHGWVWWSQNIISPPFYWSKQFWAQPRFKRRGHKCHPLTGEVSCVQGGVKLFGATGYKLPQCIQARYSISPSLSFSFCELDNICFTGGNGIPEALS